MKRTKVRLLKKNIRNLIILAILVACVILIYKLYPLSKSENIVTITMNYMDEVEQENLSFVINSDDYDDKGYYLELPQNINGIKVANYSIKNAGEEGKTKLEFHPGDKYYFSQEEINSGNVNINVIYDTKTAKNIKLYYKNLDTMINQHNVLIEGYMPKDSDINIAIADFKKTENKIKQADDTLTLNIAYDIKILCSGEKYEPNEFDENVKVTIAGIVDKENNTGLKVIHISDENKIEEVKTVSIAQENLTFNAESFSIYAIVSPSVQLYQAQDWNGSIATSFTWGDGTQNNPYLISSGAELAYLAAQVNNGTTYSGMYFKIINNINLNNNPWVPIGNATNSFCGNIDGQGFSILNAIVNVNIIEGQTGAYGIFGSLSGNATNNAVIKNIVFDNIQVTTTMSNINTSDLNYKVGVVSGAMYRYTKIENVIAKNSSIINTDWSNIAEGCYPSFFIGGLVGEAAYSSTNNTTEVTDGKYVINNCYSDVDITFGIGSTITTQVSKISVGGVIGRISRHGVWPTNCLYNGSIIDAQAAGVGPIFGGETISDTNISSIQDISTYIWNGNTTSTMTSYYSNYKVMDKIYTATCTSGVTPDGEVYRTMAGPWWNSYVWGVNKGIYTTELDTTILNMFNQNATNLGLCTWTYENDTFSMTPGLDITITETSNALYTFTISPQSCLQNPNYTYTWYINGEVDTTRTTNSSSFEPSFVNDRLVQIMVSDGTNVALGMFNLQQLTLGLTITQSNGTLTPIFTGTGAPLAKFSRYNINWYDIDVIEGKGPTPYATTISISGISLYHRYQLELTNGYEGVENLTATFIYGERKVIFVNNIGYTIDETSYVGNDTNLGASPENAVKTLTRAYQLITANGAIEGNVIVVMGNYTDTDFLDVRGGNLESYNETKQKFLKPALITGKFEGTPYNANINFSCADNVYNGKYIFADSRFEYINFNGNNGSTFFYLQGHNLTMGKGIVMTNYSMIDTSDLGQIKGVNSPKFSMFCGFHNYNYSTIPTNSKTSNVLIKSGTYGRIIAGGRNNSAGASVMTTSHNIFGSINDYFTANITIDYYNQATGKTPDVNLLVAGSTDSNIYINSTINVVSGKIARILGGNIGSNSVIYEGYPLNLFVGSTTLNISGGDITEIYGTSLGRWTNTINYYGQVEINVSGGIIRSALYGAGAASITGNNINSPYAYYSTYASGVTTGVEINISGGEIIGNIYGGGYGYSNYLEGNVTNDGGALYGDSQINITGGTISGNIFGAGKGYNYSEKTNLAQMVGDSTIIISGTPNITGNIYGAGEGILGCEGIAKLTGNSTINISADISGDIYAGGLISKIDGNTTINVNSGNHTGSIYGGGQQGDITGDSTVIVNGGTTSNIYGGGYQAIANDTSVIVKDGSVTNIYGGGNKAGVSNSIVNIKGGSIASVYGGSNESGIATTTNVILEGGNIIDAYGGNKAGGSTTNSNVYIYGGNLTNVYAGGNNADTQNPKIYLRNTISPVENIFGGGNNAGVPQSNIYLDGGTVANVYGGSNNAGTVEQSNIYIGNEEGTISTNGSEVKLPSTVSSSLNINNIYGGNNAGGMTTTSNIHAYKGNIVNIFGGGNKVNAITTNVDIYGGIIENVYGGSNKLGTITTANVTINDGRITNVYGGNNIGGKAQTTSTVINAGAITNVYGGNNAGGTTTNANTTIQGGTIENVYGGGNRAITDNVILNANLGEIDNVYGGGNQAGVANNTQVNISGAKVNNNVYGGGNEGIVVGNTNLKIKNSRIGESVYAGGNGTTAIVSGNTNLVIEGTTYVTGTAFGGGNHAATGTEGIDTSISTVDIVGGTVHGNVYGGANTSVIYGSTRVNIGDCANNISNLEKSDIVILGTVFGGGEANASGSAVYDFTFVSVTKGTQINIDAQSYTKFRIAGSIFGSGNASTTADTSIININNYGTYKTPKTNTSIQRADIVTINNSAIWLAGATDRTNEYSTVVFSLSRIKELKLKNNSTIYLQNGSNLLEKLSSVYDDGTGETKQIVGIDQNGNVTKNVDNRIYMREGVNLNVATNEQATAYGDIYGMMFLGLYAGSNKLSLGMYSKAYNPGDEVANIDRLIFTKSSYALGKHYENHDITKDGFYSNYKDENNIISSKYVEPTPSSDIYYIWNVGELAEATVYEIALTASKYNTLGTCELSLLGFSTPNTVFEYSGLTCDLKDGINLVDKNTIQNIESNQELADSNFGLGIETGKNSWMMVGSTKFLSSEPYYTGTTTYLSDNSNATPALNFYLYHSQNISIEQELGTLGIGFAAIEQTDPLNKTIKNILIYVDMDTALYQDSYYEASITPGEQYDLFTTTQTNITSRSEFSQYYSLYIEKFSESDYYDNYLTNYRTLISSCVLPANTTITMIDKMKSSTDYYYYTLTAADEASSKTKFDISNFKIMGSTDQYFIESNSRYYNSDLDIAHEEFIFHFDFSNANIVNPITNQTILLEYRDTNNETLIGVLGFLRDGLQYSVYDAGSNISVNATTSKPSVYLGQELFLNVVTDYNQTLINNKTIFDTKYFGEKLGLKITFYDSDNQPVSGSSLLGVYLELNGTKYYPRKDGTTRINIASNVSNVMSNIQINTENSNLASGNYTIKVEAFSSPDGIYYGLQSDSQTIVPITILNSIYGLSVKLEDNMVIVDSESGTTLNKNNNLKFNIDFSSGLIEPNIKVGLYRRDYTSIYSNTYNLVDLNDYVTNELTSTNISDIYLVTDTPSANFDFDLNLKQNLTTGTYKMIFSLYDGDIYIGEVYQYIIIN